MGFRLQGRGEQSRRIDVSIAVNLSVAQEAGVFEPGDQAEHSRLLAELQMILKTLDVVTGLHQVFLPELNNGVRSAARGRIVQTDGAHRTETKCVDSTPRQFFDRQAGLEITRFLEFMNCHRFC